MEKKLMKQKYEICVNEDQKKLIIKEYAELDKESYTPTCEQSYDTDQVEPLLNNSDKLIALIRNRNLYPIKAGALKIVEAINVLYESESKEPIEVIFNDMDCISKPKKEVIGEDSDVVKIDELLEDGESSDAYVEEDDIKTIATPTTLKVADEDSIDVDDESS